LSRVTRRLVSRSAVSQSSMRFEVEKLFLRHQISIALRRNPPRLRLRGVDRTLLVWMRRLWWGVCTENLNPHVMVMKSAKDGVRFDAPGRLNRARDWRIFVQ